MGAAPTEKTADDIVKLIDKIHRHYKKTKSEVEKTKKAAKLLKNVKEARDLMKRARNRQQLLKAADALAAGLDLAADLVPKSVPGLGKLLGVYAKAIGSIRKIKWDVAERYLVHMMKQLYQANRPNHVIVIVREMRERFHWTERVTLARVDAFHKAWAKRAHAQQFGS